MQGIDGSYGNAESTAQVVLALCELGIDPHTDERFNGNGVSPVDALLQYARDDGSFCHTLGGDANGMSTEQALYTLAGVQRFYEKQNSLYDMNDVNLGDGAASGAVSGVTILPSGEQVLAVNDTLQLTARVLPVNAENKTVTWSSSHPEIVSVDNYGLLTAKKLGTATITVTTVDGGKTATLTVRVQDVVKVTGVSLDSVNSPVEVGKTVQLHATVRPANATNRALRWSSDNPRIATVSASGVVRGVAEGKATIYVATMDGNFTDSVEITVKDGSSVGTVKLSVDKLTIQKGFVIKPQEVELQKGDTVWDVLKRELDRRGIRYEYSNYTQYNSIYVESIDGDGEFDHGSGSGWKYNVNGIYPDYGCSRYVLKDGDSIQWRYTTNLGDDLDEYPIEEELKEENSPVELTPEVKPDANGDAIVRIEEEMFQKVLEQVAKEKLDQIRIQPKVNGKADKVGVVLPNASVKAAVNANKEIVTATPVATLVLERTALRDLTAQSGSITVSTETKQDGTMDIRVLRGGQTVQQVRGGVPITLPDVASPGMVLVLHQNGTESVVKKSVVSHGELSARLPGSVILSVENRAGEFEDISSDHWANDAVEFVTARELFTGTGSHHFSPDSEMSRAMLATVLFRLEEGKASYNTVFSDVAPDSWYGAAVAWAAEEGIVSGTGDGFHPDEAITREQLALMLYRYVKSAEGETEHNGSLSSFRDRGDVSDWAEEAVSWAVGAGILTGRGNKHLEPQATASRAEVAAMLMRMMPLLT